MSDEGCGCGCLLLVALAVFVAGWVGGCCVEIGFK